MSLTQVIFQLLHQVSKLISRKLGQETSYKNCWWSWGTYDEEKRKWTGAVGKVKASPYLMLELFIQNSFNDQVLYGEADLAVNSLDIREDRQVCQFVLYIFLTKLEFKKRNV